jgi:hypothetical protein
VTYEEEDRLSLIIILVVVLVLVLESIVGALLQP